jgi:hypothetical protein|tara:strand:+ start:282 stop:548 length:267 start_codon:yes stop_codon:yes gene_type:complete
MEIADLIANYGFPTVMVVGLGYFVYFVYNFIQEHLDPATEKMHFQLIRVIDQMRMLDQDLIRLQQKVDVVLEYRENEQKKKAEDSKPK